MSPTALLPPLTAVRMVWALTGKFSDDQSSQSLALYVEQSLNNIEEQSRAAGVGPEEKSYITAAIATMKSSLRSLDTAYKGRTLNFDENEKLRAESLKSINESFNFGNKAQDFLKSLPAMTIGAAGGTTVIHALFGNLSEASLWGAGIAMAALGYLLKSLCVRYAGRKTQLLYVVQDYERDLYYEQYVNRVKIILEGLLLDLERIHKKNFDNYYETDIGPGGPGKVIDGVLAGIKSTFCPYVHKHITGGKVTPELWTRCESGMDEAVRTCPLWEGRKQPDAVGAR
ncbi:MAG: hypothetical protein V1816_04240 [Pseudomonadota bacterium]